MGVDNSRKGTAFHLPPMCLNQQLVILAEEHMAKRRCAVEQVGIRHRVMLIVIRREHIHAPRPQPLSNRTADMMSQIDAEHMASPPLKTASNQPYAVRDLLWRLPKTAWVRTEIKDGSKGPIVCDLAVLRVTEARGGLPGPRQWLVIRRSLHDPTDVRYYLSNAPETTAKTVLAAMGGRHWPVELLFETGKGELDMDHDEVRSWAGWHHHMVLMMLAHHRFCCLDQHTLSPGGCPQ